jgi:cytochrome c oxidase subunit III
MVWVLANERAPTPHGPERLRGCFTLVAWHRSPATHDSAGQRTGDEMGTGETVGLDAVEGSGGVARARGEPHVSALAVGVVVWLASELMFFSGLFAAYYTLRATTNPWPPSDVDLNTPRAAIATAVLVLSSFTMHSAVGAAKQQDRVRSARWLTATLLLGALFIVNLCLEYAESPFSISTNAYGSMFFLMTGFHGLHVMGGLFFMIAVIWIISGPTSRAPVAPTIEVCAYYWHFVDLVWVVMFANLYLLQ